MFKKSFRVRLLLPIFAALFLATSLTPAVASALTLSQSSGFGIAGTITSPPPTSAATITTPTNGQTFTTVPVTVSGICTNGLLIKIFINTIFSGAADCVGNSYSISVDLFIGTNNIIAEDYDSLNQAGPPSNTVTVTYVNNSETAGSLINLTSNYAKIGANPGSTLTWPIDISGGTAPYAISVNWGDGKQPSLISQTTSGSLNLTHIYSIAGVYDVTINATDSVGGVAFLQLVGVGDGPASQSPGAASSKSTTVKTVGLSDGLLGLVIGLLLFIPLITFWLGDLHQKKLIQSRFANRQKLF
jgi:hypothetical protein